MNSQSVQLSNQKKYDQPLQDYGVIAKEYLKEKDLLQYTTLLTEGTLMEYLHELQTKAINQEILLEEQILQEKPYPKTENPLVIEAHLKVIQSLAREQVITDIQIQLDNL
ncbi:TnpV protein [Enterococcus faecalis]|uniref:TnpV protein n=1 Tax=Enterococcus faecalis TaxID=1351 RepID=UPI0035CB1527